eukprot:scpid79252/ scgid2229/ 
MFCLKKTRASGLRCCPLRKHPSDLSSLPHKVPVELCRHLYSIPHQYSAKNTCLLPAFGYSPALINFERYLAIFWFALRAGVESFLVGCMCLWLCVLMAVCAYGC